MGFLRNVGRATGPYFQFILTTLLGNTLWFPCTILLLIFRSHRTNDGRSLRHQISGLSSGEPALILFSHAASIKTQTLCCAHKVTRLTVSPFSLSRSVSPKGCPNCAKTLDAYCSVPMGDIVAVVLAKYIYCSEPGDLPAESGVWVEVWKLNDGGVPYRSVRRVSVRVLN